MNAPRFFKKKRLMLIKYFGTTNCEIDKEYRKHKMVTFSCSFFLMGSCISTCLLFFCWSFLFCFFCLYFHFKAKKFLLTSRKLVEVNYSLKTFYAQFPRWKFSQKRDQWLYCVICALLIAPRLFIILFMGIFIIMAFMVEEIM